jgi:hypothetical protein
MSRRSKSKRIIEDEDDPMDEDENPEENAKDEPIVEGNILDLVGSKL